MFQTALLITAGGAVGTTLRYCISLWLMPVSKALPWGTLLINVGGSLLIAFVATLAVAQGRCGLPATWRDAVTVGLCGGFTTFSSFSLQTLELLRGGMPLRALAYVLLSVTLCLAAAAMGYSLAERINLHREPTMEALSKGD